MVIDPIAELAANQSGWKLLPLGGKLQILQEMRSILESMSMEEHFIPLLGIPEVQMMGFQVTNGAPSCDEGRYESAQAAMIYAVIVRQAVDQLLQVYQYHATPPKKLPAIFRASKTSWGKDQTIVTTFPLTKADTYTPPFGKSQVDLWLQPGCPYEPFALLENEDTKNAGCMMVLGAGNQSFLSVMDCLHGLFHCHCTVLLKHHPLRAYQNDLLAMLFAPLIRRGYFAMALDTPATRDMVYHPLVRRVHLTGGAATHDALVRDPRWAAEMTAELGCITPWIIAPQSVPWTHQQMRHQVQHLFASMYSNAGANCNSPKVILLPWQWSQKNEFMQSLCREMAAHPLPLAYYPQSAERWQQFRQAYPTQAVEIGGSAASRVLQDSAVVLPWLVITLPDPVDLSTEEGRKRAQSEYAFLHEPFCPVVTFAFYHRRETALPKEEAGADDDVLAAVALANDCIYGSLSCTIVTADGPSDDALLREAVAQLRYGAIGINVWTAMVYAAPGSPTWGAFPGATESGAGQVQNHWCIREVTKSVLYTPLVDEGLHVRRPESYRRGRLECVVVGNLTLCPGLYRLANLLTVAVTGCALPSPTTMVVALVVLMSGIWTMVLPKDDA